MRGADVLPVFPVTARMNTSNHLEIGGCDVLSLAEQYGTPLYVFDEETIREVCRSFMEAFSARYPNVQPLYASKAFTTTGLVRLVQSEGYGLDVVSAGEAAVAAKAGFPMEKVYFHGNNKGREELEYVLQLGLGRVVVDNLDELALLEAVCEKAKKKQDILLRISPGVDPHTHAHTTTGILDSKFGLPIVTGHAEEAVKRATTSEWVTLLGLHFHLGSPIWETHPFEEAIDIVLKFAKEMMRKHGMRLDEFSPGGGFAVRYLLSEEPPTADAYAEVITKAIKAGCAEHEIALPKVLIEPGRAVVGRAGVAVYTVGAIKNIPGIRTYVAVDGGMGDNIRPAIYGSKYEAVLANRMSEEVAGPVTIAGKYCESGDILVKDIKMPMPKAGDRVAVPVSGAYCLAMSSNYNLAQKPAVVLVKDGQSKVWRRRETFEDLMRYDSY